MDQLGIKAYEIDDISVDRILATKFITRQPSVSQRVPQPSLGIALCRPQRLALALNCAKPIFKA
jgi:hypothetical protein